MRWTQAPSSDDDRSTVETLTAGSAFVRRSSKSARKRLGEVAVITAVLALVLQPLRGWLLFGFNHPAWLREIVPLGVAGVCLDVAMLLTVRRRKLRDDDVLRWGLVYFVLRTALLAAYPTRLYTTLGYEVPALTIAHGFALVFPLFVSLDAKTTARAVSVAMGVQALVALTFSAVVPTALVIGSVVGMSVAMVFIVWVCTRVATPAEVSGYHLVRRLSVDAHGFLWLARHPHFARPAAIRTVNPRVWRKLSLPSPHAVERYARAAARLRSPYSVMLYDYGTASDGSLYMVSEFVEGEALATYVRRTGSLAPSSALRIAREVSESLIEAHERGLVHHGVVPKNVFLCRLGRREQSAKLAKFDVANIEHLLERPDPDPRAESLWEAPERRAGKRCDSPSDIYQLGRLLEFMVTAREPSTTKAGEDPAFVPAAVTTIVERCTRVNPAKRPRAHEVRDALERALESVGERPRNEALDDLPILSGGTGNHTATKEARRDASHVLRAPNAQGEKKKRKPAPLLGEQVREGARRRLSQVAIADTVVSVGMTFVSDLTASVNLDPHWYRVLGLVLLSIVTLDVCLFVVSKRRAFGTDFVLRAGAAFFVLRAVIICVGTLHLNTLLGVEQPIMTFAPLVVLFVPLFIPLSPAKLAVAAALCAMVEPLATRYLVQEEVPELWQGSVLTAVSVFVLSEALAFMLYGSRRIASEREVFGAYRRGELIGQGGNGSVWRARHDLLERSAALKLLGKEHLTSDERKAWLERFLREARLTANLTSPNTVRIYDYGTNQLGVAYFVMELLDGENLQAYVKRAGPLSADEVIAIALRICDSLGEAHALGIVHRDVKPANVVLVRNGDRVSVKVLDFGLADFMERVDNSASASGRFEGTPAFMPPEAFLGQPIDARSDIYELGCLLYFLLSGRNVFVREALTALALAHVRDTPSDIIKLSPSRVPRELARIIERCLKKNPSERYQSIEELEEDLLGLQDVERGWAPPADRAAPNSSLVPSPPPPSWG